MNQQAVAPKTVLETLLEWSAQRPLWQRDALRRIVAQGKLDETDIAELVELCKMGFGATSDCIQAIPLERGHLPANPGSGAAVTLLAVGEVVGANNLAPDQTLSFAPNGLTVIYGDNGAGKSGYARILKRACRSRHAGRIEPNVYDATAPKVASANITFAIGGTDQAPVRWEDAPQPHALLSAISVFDSDCATVHLKEKNEVAFRPFGLDIPDELAGACQAVKEVLQAEQRRLESIRNPIFVSPAWKTTTEVGKVLTDLGAVKDVDVIRQLAVLTPEESNRLERLRDDLAKNPATAAAEQTLRADNIKRVTTFVRDIEAATTNEALALVRARAEECRTKREAAYLAAQRAFGGERMPGIGGSVWRELWESARRYALSTADPAVLFPPTTAVEHCVLCLQPLGADALARMTRFEAFIQQDTAQQAERAERTATEALQSLTSVDMRTGTIRAALAELRLRDNALWKRVYRYLANARLRRHALLKNLDGSEPVALPPVLVSPVPQLSEVEADIRRYADELRRSAGAEERKRLEVDLAELSDRAILADVLPTVLEEIERLREIRFLGECIAGTSTNTITRIGNEIADNLITPRMRDRFQEEIVRLAAEKVRVEIVRSGGKYGSPQYQIRLFAKPDAKVHDILSEGERTCVALAAFLTELATAAHQSALVFDDPVSSLDHRWRAKVADRLVEEAAQRQVIVFTHDLVFVNDLLDRAAVNGQKPHLVTLSRGPTGAGQVAEGLPWKAQSVEDRLDRLEKAARSAQDLHNRNDEDAYESEVARIYSNLRATWERALEDIAFFRVVQRHRDYINAKDLKKVSVLTEPDCDAFATGYKRCCDIVDAHDPSSGRNASAPPPADMMQDIQALKNWAASLRARQKQVA